MRLCARTGTRRGGIRTNPYSALPPGSVRVSGLSLALRDAATTRGKPHLLERGRLLQQLMVSCDEGGDCRRVTGGT